MKIVEYIIVVLILLACVIVINDKNTTIKEISSRASNNDSVWSQEVKYKQDSINTYTALLYTQKDLIESGNHTIALLKTKLNITSTDLKKYKALAELNVSVTDTIIDTLLKPVRDTVDYTHVDGKDTTHISIIPPKSITVKSVIHCSIELAAYMETVPSNPNKPKFRNWMISHTLTRFLVKTKQAPRFDIFCDNKKITIDSLTPIIIQ